MPDYRAVARYTLKKEQINGNHIFIAKDILKTKPPYSPKPQRWLEKGGKIEIDGDGNWIYTNSDGISVKYVDDYPDFKSAGLVNQEADIGEFVNREVDKRKAKKSV